MVVKIAITAMTITSSSNVNPLENFGLRIFLSDNMAYFNMQREFGFVKNPLLKIGCLRERCRAITAIKAKGFMAQFLQILYKEKDPIASC
jgi:hypothetical protein